MRGDRMHVLVLHAMRDGRPVLVVVENICCVLKSFSDEDDGGTAVCFAGNDDNGVVVKETVTDIYALLRGEMPHESIH